MFNVKAAKKPVIRKEYQEVKAPLPSKPRPVSARHASLTTPAQALARERKRQEGAGRRQGEGEGEGKSPAALATAGAGKSTTDQSRDVKSRDRLDAPGGGRKRQRNGTPVAAVDMWGSSDSSSESGGDSSARRGGTAGQKRRRAMDSATSDSHRLGRDAWRVDDVVSAADLDGLIHGADLTSGKLQDMTGLGPSKYKEYFERAEGDEIPVVELQYPSHAPPERFQLVWPIDPSDFNPINEIHDTVQTILTHYLPAHMSGPLLDEASGIPRRLKIAFNDRSLAAFTSTLTEFNTLLTTALSDNTIKSHLQTTPTIPLPLIERLLERQTYDRTVAPHADKLNARKDQLPSKSNTYGEIRPRLTHDMLLAAGLDSSHVFVDLGSGVGNVVLQAALETGAECWGVEMMDTPALLGARQLAELRLRARLYAIRPGPARLLHADMRAAPAIDAVLARADVVLVNNKVFEADLNEAIALMFLDLKEGARVLSLQPFVRGSGKVTELNMHGPRVLLRLVAEMRYGSSRVSWTDAPGEWYLSVKDSKRLRDFVERGRRAARRRE